MAEETVEMPYPLLQISSRCGMDVPNLLVHYFVEIGARDFLTPGSKAELFLKEKLLDYITEMIRSVHEETKGTSLVSSQAAREGRN